MGIRLNHDMKGVCLLSGTCESNPDHGLDTTVMDKVLDIYGENKTRDNEDDCHARAAAIFKKCGNGVGTPITATYVLKNGTSSSISFPFKGRKT